MSAIPLAEQVYPHLPVFLQNIACWNHGRNEAHIRFGNSFQSRLSSLMETENLSDADIRAYQDEKVKQLIAHVYDNVPYYHDVINSLKLTPKDISCVADLQKLPILTKEDIRNNFDRLVSRKAKVRELIHRHTSGTSGKALHFYSSKSSISFQWAVWWRLRLRFGLKFGTWHANFTGKLVVPPEQVKPPYWRWNSPCCQALLNMHHLTPSKIRAVIDFLNGQEFEFYTGYPSIIHMLAVNARDAGLELTSRPRVICTGAEPMNDLQRRDIELLTHATLTDHWGLSEGCGNAAKCPHRVYHEDFEFGVLECADPHPAGGQRLRGRLVCTGFANWDFPFIRYDTGDSGTWESSDFRCACGRQSRVLDRIEGRQEDYVITPEGARIMRFDYIFKDTMNVKEAQVLQERPGAIKMRVVRRPEYCVEDEQSLASEIKRWISPRIEVCFEYVDEIERESSGKFKAVKSLISTNRTVAPLAAPAATGDSKTH
jgi:phenylacetate-CoA ligase